MSARREKHSAAFKTKVVLKALKERNTLSELASKYEVSQFMICRWKKEFSENSAMVFNGSTPKSEARQERRCLICEDRSIGDGSGFLKEGIGNLGYAAARGPIISKGSKLSINKQLSLLSIGKGQYYYTPVEESEEDIEIMNKIDEKFADNQTIGVIKMTEYLKLDGYSVGLPIATKCEKPLMSRPVDAPIKQLFPNCLLYEEILPYSVGLLPLTK